MFESEFNSLNSVIQCIKINWPVHVFWQLWEVVCPNCTKRKANWVFSLATWHWLFNVWHFFVNLNSSPKVFKWFIIPHLFQYFYDCHCHVLTLNSGTPCILQCARQIVCLERNYFTHFTEQKIGLSSVWLHTYDPWFHFSVLYIVQRAEPQLHQFWLDLYKEGALLFRLFRSSISHHCQTKLSHKFPRINNTIYLQ